MGFPLPTPQSDLAPHEYVRQRVELNRGHADWRELRREQRTGGASYREVRYAKYSYLKARRRLEQVCDASRQGPAMLPAL